MKKKIALDTIKIDSFVTRTTAAQKLIGGKYQSETSVGQPCPYTGPYC